MDWGRCKTCGHQLEVLVNVPTCERCDWGNGGAVTNGDEFGPYYVVMTDEELSLCEAGDSIPCALFEDETEAADFVDSLGVGFSSMHVEVVYTFEKPGFEWNQIYDSRIAGCLYNVHFDKPLFSDMKFIDAWLLHRE